MMSAYQEALRVSILEYVDNLAAVLKQAGEVRKSFLEVELYNRAWRHSASQLPLQFSRKGLVNIFGQRMRLFDNR